MRILLFGRDGQLGWELQRCVSPLGKLMAIDKEDLDLAQEDELVNLIREYQPDVILNAAAYTAVDRAETDKDLAFAVNGIAPGVIGEGAKSQNAAMIHYSTDYVFDGEKAFPYVETDTPNPINTYGITKLAGERAVQSTCDSYLIIRTSWVYSMRLPSFPTKVLDWSREQELMRVVDDQIGSPTWSRMLAEITGQIISRSNSNPFEFFRERVGTYHVAGLGAVSRYEWALAVLEYDPASGEQIVQEVERARSDEFETAARRPAYSALDCSFFQDLFDIRIPDWKENLAVAMKAAG